MFEMPLRFLPRKGKEIVNRCIRQVVVHAYEKVPFYRRLYQKAGANPTRIHNPDDLQTLPLTSRLNLMSSGPDGYLRRDTERESLTIRHTTGTTGTPVIIHMNTWEEAFRRITLIDSYRRHISLRFPMTLVDVGCERKDHATQTVKRMGPVTIVRLFRMAPMHDKIKILSALKPDIMHGRPSVLWELALALHDRSIKPPTPRLIVSGAELLFPHVRTLLENVFHCRVVDHYNCEEAGNLAWQCPADPACLHPNTATVWLETVDSRGGRVPAGTEGRLIITNLFNYSMPFIRYDMGDKGILLNPRTCRCGFDGPVMRLTEGRHENFITLPDGREITPRLMYEVVTSAFPYENPQWNMAEVLRVFQIIQEEEDLIVIKVVPGPAYSESLWHPVRDNLRRLHPAMRLTVATVDNLDPAPGQKFHQVLGKLNSRWKNEIERNRTA